MLPSLCLLQIRYRLVGNSELLRFLDRHPTLCYQISSFAHETTGETVTKNSKVFDIIVLAGMVVNIILAVFLILYYFDFL